MSTAKGYQYPFDVMRKMLRKPDDSICLRDHTGKEYTVAEIRYAIINYTKFGEELMVSLERGDLIARRIILKRRGIQI